MRMRLCLLFIMAALPSFFSANARAELPASYDFTFIPDFQFTVDTLIHSQYLNNAGQIIGESHGQAALWQDGNITLLDGAVSSINNSGQMAGTIDGHAVIWNDLVPTELQSLTAGGHSQAVAINDSGQAIGYSDSASGWVPVIWNGTTPTEISPAGEVTAINNHGQIAGMVNAGTETHAALWDGNNFTDLGLLAVNGRNRAFTQSINDAGQVVGFSANIDDDFAPQGPFLWQDGVMTELEGTVAAALDINNQGQIVGLDDAFHVGSNAVIWDEGKQYDLNSFLSPKVVEDGWLLLIAHSINDRGQVEGFGVNFYTNVSGTFLLTPIPEPATYTMLMAGLGLIAFAARRRKLPSPKLVRHARF